jgi:hypothetical protein
VRLLARLLIVAAVASLPVGAALVSCGTDAVGINACREVEEARCNAAPVCEGAGFNVSACAQFYQDECLVGIENPSDAGDTALNGYGMQCATDIGTLAACIDAGKPIAACGVSLVDGGVECGDAGLEAGAPTECQILTVCPELIASCNFIAISMSANGSACSTGTTCESGYCVDSICCAASSCSGECLTGTCSTGTCDLQPPGFACTAGTCTGVGDNSLSGLGVCDGTGTCHMNVTEITCTAGTCAPTGCTSCTTDAQCSPFSWCSAGACTAKGLTGAACSASTMCANGSCNSSMCN